MRNKKENIALIGMPGSGKSTVGKILADRLGYEFYDTDELIEKTSGKSIAEIFEEGETVFRLMEASVCEELSKDFGKVISTGGGVAKSRENMEVLRQGSLVIFLERDIESIARDIDFSIRPLLKDGIISLKKLHEERVDLYRQYSHITVDANCSKEETVKKIITITQEREYENTCD
ncbi:shikimate kinase [Desulfitispora alkaliphila]|uniref:shikimate kinase n=1 Tax=Desulfitispora alkaliphila TaxID=622674 RepID=UPI003D215414